MSRRPATADLPRKLLDILAGAGRPLTARELGDIIGVRQDSAQRALMRALADGRVMAAYGDGASRKRPLVYALARPAQPARHEPARRPAARERACLACGAFFMSAGPQNRLCPACRGRSGGAGPFETPHFIRT